MVIDERLLEGARAAGDKLAAADREALLARAEYHTAVRRLHLAGGSLREIGEALGMSHQRVQQIVEAAGGSWWQRVWRNRTRRRDAVCTFCGRPPSEVKKLVAGPDVYLCDRCAAAATQALAGRTAHGIARAIRGSCSFCGKRAASARPVAAADEAAVCADCLAMCRQIIDAS
jgi:hypothetical protein